jgi:Fe-S cluster assembly scaffold protein SufB
MVEARLMSPETERTLTALRDAPMSVPAAREHWKYSRLQQAQETVMDAPANDGVDVSTVPGALQAMLADSGFCPLTCDLVLRHPRIRHLHLTEPGTLELPAASATTPTIIQVDAGVRVEIVDRTASSSAWTICLVAENAALAYHRLRSDGEVQEWNKLQFVQHGHSQVTLTSFATAAAFRRHDVSVDLLGGGSAFRFDGAAVAGGRQHLDLQSHVRHHAPHTTSEQRWHTIGQERSTLTYRGRIYIAEQCNGVDAALTNRNLALGSGVTINTKPELEIYSDDVRCAHGATVGQLDGETLFFLRARGIDEITARRMLAVGFLRECLSGPLAEDAALVLTRSVA